MSLGDFIHFSQCILEWVFPTGINGTNEYQHQEANRKNKDHDLCQPQFIIYVSLKEKGDS